MDTLIGLLLGLGVVCAVIVLAVLVDKAIADPDDDGPTM